MENAVAGRLRIDRKRCEGYGMCQQAAPDLLHLNDDDEPVVDVDEIPADRRALAEAAVRACPVAALTLST